jgi:hypothetical protein
VQRGTALTGRAVAAVVAVVVAVAAAAAAGVGHMGGGWAGALRGGGAGGALALLLASGAAWAQGEPAQVGQWSPVRSWPDTATHLVLLPNDKVMSIGEFGINTVYLWDWKADRVSQAPWPGYNPFCGGHHLLPDGRLFFIGGHKRTDQGENKASIYDPWANSWTRLPDMNAGRWYPTALTLPSGEMLALGGTDETTYPLGDFSNPLPQVWQPQANAWRDLTTARRPMYYYPWSFVAPDGRVFSIRPSPRRGEVPGAFLFDPSGTGAVTRVGVPAGFERDEGSAVMYDDGKVLMSGGGERFAKATAEVVDLNASTPAFRRVPAMAQPRKYHNMTLLPDGTVLVTGGVASADRSDTAQGVHATELWDPETERFRTLAPAARITRSYHSSALLLPDGRVLYGGGEDLREQNTRTVQLFSPPYLFKGERPVVQGAPGEVRYGETFSVRTPDAARVARVTLLAPGAVTHAFNQGQRFHALTFARGDGEVRVVAPLTRIQAPPGHYLLFLLDEEGVPSQGQWVRLGGESVAVPPERVVLGMGSPWRFHDAAAAPGEGWQEPGFDDAGWKTGRALFSTREEASDRTHLAVQPGQSSVYFRRTFVLQGPLPVTARVRVRYEDGVGVWVNGQRVMARNLGNGTGHEAWASDGVGGEVAGWAWVPVPLLREGENVLAVQLKRVTATQAAPDPELRFDLELSAATQGRAEGAPVLTLTAPNGGESVEGGTTLPVTWRSEGGAAPAAVTLRYSTDDGATWSLLAEGVPNTGRYDWRVPGLDSPRVRLRVGPAAGGGAQADASDAAFRIRPGTGTPVKDADAPETPAVTPCDASGAARCASSPAPPATGGCAAAGASPSALALLLLGVRRLLRRRAAGRP